MTAPSFADLDIHIPTGATGEIDTTCPRCSPTRKKSRARCPSVNTELGTYYCHHCGWAGSLGANDNGYGARFRHRVNTPPPKRVYVAPSPLPNAPLSTRIVQWFAARGIPEWVLIEAGIRWADGAILFPYLRDGSLVNIKHRTLDKRFWMVANAERILYGLDAAIGASTVVFVEGEMDALSIRAVEGPPALSVPDGAPPPDAKHYASKFSFLGPDTLFRLQSATTILIGTDMDAPGMRLADELAQRLGYARCIRVSWLPFKDANEMLVADGPRAVLDALAAGKPFPAPRTDSTPQRVRPVRLLPPNRGCRSVVTLEPAGGVHAR